MILTDTRKPIRYTVAAFYGRFRRAEGYFVPKGGGRIAIEGCFTDGGIEDEGGETVVLGLMPEDVLGPSSPDAKPENTFFALNRVMPANR